MDNFYHNKSHTASLPLSKIIPNMVTMMALISGITSVQKAMTGDFEMAVMLLLVAGIFDVLDGAIARALKAQSEFGAQLDSFSDFLAFGVAPGLILYEWTLGDAGKLGWIAAVIFPVAAALRLARFNVMAKLADETPLWKKQFFSGVPTPAGAILCLFPIYVWFLTPETFEGLKWGVPFVAVWAIMVAALMVSRLPTFSIKYIKIPAKMMVPTMALVALFFAALFHTPWVTLPLVCIVYMASIPVILHKYRQLEKEHLSEEEGLSSLAFGFSVIDTTPHEDE
jgi:CDP-diacylglycerol--serine O-phosphatidyltransferase